MNNYQICARCIMDTSDPGIRFDFNGICNRCTKALRLLKSYPYNLSKIEKEKRLKLLVDEVKRDGRGKQFDCVIGVSGGVDSTYTALVVKRLGLRPLAVHLDNGWNSELAQKNVESFLKKLDIELYTYVINWEEFKDLQLAFLKSSTPDSEIPTDHAIVAVLYHVAIKYNLHFILTGVNQSTESVAAPAWSNGIYDWKYVSSIQKKFGTVPLKTFPHFSLVDLAYYRFVRRIKRIAFLDYIDYQKDEALAKLKKELDFRYYGNKHYESVYTRFYQAYILPHKFGYDKRRIHLSSLIITGQMTRREALIDMKKPLYEKDKLKADIEYVVKKFDLTPDSFQKILKLPNRSFYDYPSYTRDWYYQLLLKLNQSVKNKTADKYFY